MCASNLWLHMGTSVASSLENMNCAAWPRRATRTTRPTASNLPPPRSAGNTAGHWGLRGVDICLSLDGVPVWFVSRRVGKSPSDQDVFIWFQEGQTVIDKPSPKDPAT